MRVKLHLCQVLSYYADNHSSIEVNGNTVAECLDNLAAQFPDLRKVMETVKLGGNISVFMNQEDTDIEDLSKTIKEGDELNLIFHVG